VGDYTVLGSNVRVRGDADLERSVVHDNAYLAEGVRCVDHVIGRHRTCARRSVR
jgi:mannose-1-phosphate guanylyltransferase / phosphomannomutase